MVVRDENKINLDTGTQEQSTSSSHSSSQAHNYNVKVNEDTKIHFFKQNKSKRIKKFSFDHFVPNPEENINYLEQDDSILKIKIADLGNVCWINHHYTDNIQTQEYRSPEAIIGAEYDPTCDIWSCACVAYELATGECLFKSQSGENYTIDENHLALIIQTLGPIPNDMVHSGIHSKRLFNRNGTLKNINDLKHCSLYKLLREKHQWNDDEAQAFTDFLTQMLIFDPKLRATSYDCLNHPWYAS